MCDDSTPSDNIQRYTDGRIVRFLYLPLRCTHRHTLHLKLFTVQNVSSHLRHRGLSQSERENERVCVKSMCICEVRVCVCETEREKLSDGDSQEGGVSLNEDRGVQLDLM